MKISKSQYIRGQQCHKSLWLLKNNSGVRDQADTAQQSLFSTGYTVGELAKDLFSGGVEIEFDNNDYDSMIKRTRELIDNGQEVIYEAAFRENNIFVMIDILVKNGNQYDIYEVKASTSVKDYHKNDVSIQWFVISQAIDLNSAFLVHINNQYIRQGTLEIDQLFSINDITDIVQQKQSSIRPELDALETMLSKGQPNIDIGEQCSEPYNCDFQGHCWAHIPEVSVFNLYRMNKNKKFALYSQGIIKYSDIPDDTRLSASQKVQIEVEKSQKAHIDKVLIKQFLDTIEYPINFFDFETFQNAVPRFDGQRSYMQMTFQYSLHILYKDGTLEHKEFLADENSDPRAELAEQMLKDISASGSIMAYNQGFETARIRELAEFIPDKQNKLLALNERFIDLIIPFRSFAYYHPDFNGSLSIKSVLPALFPNNNELDYKQLGSVQDGAMAMNTFANLHLIENKQERKQIRADLLAYCRLDTLAMVRILEELITVCNSDVEA